MDDKKTTSTTDATEIAERMARENREAVPGGPTASVTVTPGTKTTLLVEEHGNIDDPLVDIYGRPFDPVLHLTKMDGTTPALRKGLLICKKGQGLVVPRVRAASPRAAATGGGAASDQQRLALEALGGGAPDASGAPTPAEAGPDPMAPEEFTRQAVARARAARKITGKLGRWLGGKDGDFQDVDGANEGEDIEGSTLDVQTEYQKLLPVGSILMAVMAYGSYFVRVARAADRRRKEAARAKAGGARPIPEEQEHQDKPADADDQLKKPDTGDHNAATAAFF